MLQRDRQRVPQGPHGQWLLGCLRQYRRNPLQLMLQAHRDYGDIVSYRVGPVRVVQLNHPEYARHVLVNSVHNYQKARNIERLAPLMGESLFLSEGQPWHEKRTLMQPAFRKDGSQKAIDVLKDVVSERLARWERLPDGQIIDLTSEFMEVSLSFVGRTLFAIDLGAVAGMATLLDNLLQVVSARVTSINPLNQLVPTAANRGFKRDLGRLSAIISDLIAKRREMLQGGDLFSALDDDPDPERRKRRLRDELVTFCLAGRGPTGIALAWMFYLLGRYPDVWRRVRDEVDSVLCGRVLSEDNLAKLSYCGMVFEEAMRLYPPIWAITRQATAPDQIAGYSIRPGDLLIVSPYVIHRHPGFWEAPERFDPERFNRAGSGLCRQAYLPFGLGPRMCIGNRFALTEARVVLAMIALRFQLCLTSDEVIEPEPRITLRPRGGVNVRLHQLVKTRKESNAGRD